MGVPVSGLVVGVPEPLVDMGTEISRAPAPPPPVQIYQLDFSTRFINQISVSAGNTVQLVIRAYCKVIQGALTVSHNEHTNTMISW